MKDIFFKSEEHKERFLLAMRNKIYDGKMDQEYGPALYVMTASVSIKSKAAEYVHNDGIDFEAMLEQEYFSSSESTLVRLAGNLFTGDQHVDPVELLCLDKDNFEVALQAIRLRRDAHSVE